VAQGNLDYHIEIEKHFYSVPFRLLREEVEAQITAKTVEIFHRGGPSRRSGWPERGRVDGGGFGLDKRIAPNIVGHYAINGQERAGHRGYPLGTQKRQKMAPRPRAPLDGHQGKMRPHNCQW
jgi:hypothetical protein